MLQNSSVLKHTRNMWSYLFMKAKCEAAYKDFWMSSHVPQALHYYLTDAVCEGIVGKTELKNRFLPHCKITIRSGVWFLKLEEVTMPFKSRLLSQAKQMKKKKTQAKRETSQKGNFWKLWGQVGRSGAVVLGSPCSLQSSGPWGISLWLPAVVHFTHSEPGCLVSVTSSQASLAFKCEKLRYLWGWYLPYKKPRSGELWRTCTSGPLLLLHTIFMFS